MSLKKYINDKSPYPQSTQELDGALLIFEGHDRPRYIYRLNEEAGYLGLETMNQPWFTPQYVDQGTGTLTSAKYYSIIVVPIKTDISAGGLPIYGEASPYSIPQTPGADNKSLNFTIPVHPQKIIKDCGLVFDSMYYQLEDDTKAWETNQHVGATAKNVETGKEYAITGNTATVLTFANGSFSSGDRYQILRPTATARAIYACEMAAAADVGTSDFYLRDIVNDNTTTTYALTAFAESSDIWNFSGVHLPPPNANTAQVLANLVFCGGGITENRGKAKIDTATAANIQSTVDDSGTVGAISKFEDSTKAWTPDEHIGLSLVNSLNEEETITDNTATEMYPALIDGVKFNKTDPYFILDKTATPDVTEDVTFVPATNKLTFLDTASPDESGTAQAVTADTITFADTTGTADLTATVSLKTDNDLTFVAVTGSAAFTASVTKVVDSFPYIDINVAYAPTFIGKWLTNSSNVPIAKITGGGYRTASSCYLILDRASGLTIGNSVKAFSSSITFVSNFYAGKLLYFSGSLVGRIESNTADTITLIGHGLSVGNSVSVFTGTWTVDQWKDYVLHDGATVKGIIESNTIDTLTATAHGLSVSDDFDISLGSWNISEFVGKFVLDDSAVILGRVTANTQNTLTLNAVHGLSATDEFNIITEADSGTVTFPTSFKVTGKTWTVDEHAGKVIDFSATANKTILFNTADSIALTDSSMPASAETYDILSSSLSISHSYSFSDEAGVEHKVARYTIAGELEDANALPSGTYAGDYVTVADSGEAGNNVTSAKILRVDAGRKWFEVENSALVAGDAAAGTTVTITRNHITGNTSGANKTYFTEGMVDAQVKFAQSGEKVFRIVWVDPINQTLGINELYTSPVTEETVFEVFSDYPLYYSDSRNPHAWGAANIIDLYNITGFSSVGNSLLVFGNTSLTRVDIESLGAAPVLISDNVRCAAPFSIVRGEKYTLFYDGTGFSMTDGVTAQSLTAYKLRDYLANLNKAYESNIRGVYDRANKRFEFTFAMGTGTTNDYGVYITEDTWNCFPFMRPDCNALWTNYSEGNLDVFHGTSGIHEEGTGSIWKHTGDIDGTVSGSLTITAIAGQVVTATSATTLALAVGDSLTVYPVASGEEAKQLIIHAIEQDGTSYEITFDDGYDLTAYIAGDLLLAGYVTFDFGIKWTDFGSPQYLHQPRALHLDFEDMNGTLFVDQFLDMNDTPLVTDSYELTSAKNKLVIPFRMGKGYKYGFRLRGYSSTRLKISDFVSMFDTQS